MHVYREKIPTGDIESDVERKRRSNEVQIVKRKSVNMQYARESSDFPAIDITRWVLFE